MLVLKGLLVKAARHIRGGALESSAEYVERLRRRGISIGDGCHFFDPSNTLVDTQRPHLLTIGQHVKVASGAIILAHDFSRSVCMDAYGVNIGDAGETRVGDNVFIGMNAILLMGCKVGDNSIVGAGAVVSGEFPPDSVIGGNPAKVICTLQRYREKRRARERDAALLFAERFRDRFGRWPNVEEMTDSFSWLYLPRDEHVVAEHPNLFRLSGVNREKAIEAFMASEPEWPSFEAFLEDAKAYRAGEQDC